MQVISIIVGITSLLGVLALLAYLHFMQQSRTIERSIGELVGGDKLFDAPQILQILKEFKEDSLRLEALKTLTNLDATKAEALLSKVKKNIDVDQMLRVTSGHYIQISKISAIFFVSIAIAGLAYIKINPTSTLPTDISAPMQKEQLPAGKKFRDCESSECPWMVVIPPGSFHRGHSENLDQVVNIKYKLAVGVYELTNEQWNACIKSIPSGNCQNDITSQISNESQHPVGNVTWESAQQYVSWLSRYTGKRYRLPSEAEWEYFARGGSAGVYYWGDDSSAADKYAWHRENAKGKKVEVGQKKPNAFGLYVVV